MAVELWKEWKRTPGGFAMDANAWLKKAEGVLETNISEAVSRTVAETVSDRTLGSKIVFPRLNSSKGKQR